MNREAIYKALYAKLQRIDGIRDIGRRLKPWTDVLEFPAVFLAQGNEQNIKGGRGLPNKYELSPSIYLYVKVEVGEIPGPVLNEFLDSITQALKPAEGAENKQTLGGLVEDCWIDGQVITDEGTLGEMAVAVIPIKIVVAH
jgi:hypothetical protein